jgi:hypothetical protein
MFAMAHDRVFFRIARRLNDASVPAMRSRFRRSGEAFSFCPATSATCSTICIGIDTFVLSGYPALEEAYYVAELLFPKLPIRRETWPAEAVAAG